jgi:hypothetical protein
MHAKNDGFMVIMKTSTLRFSFVLKNLIQLFFKIVYCTQFFTSKMYYFHIPKKIYKNVLSPLLFYDSVLSPYWQVKLDQISIKIENIFTKNVYHLPS